MKILIDQNISFRIIHHLEHLSFDLHHVKTLGLTDANDHQIFRFARQNAFDAILSLDEDFYNILLAKGTPPKVIWLRLQNASVVTQALHIAHNFSTIEHFLKDANADCFEIFSQV